MESFTSKIPQSSGNGGLKPSTTRLLRLSELSVPRQLLVRLCHATNYGYIEGLEVRDSDPIFNPEPRVWVEVKLDVDEGPRPELHLADFTLPNETCRLMARLNEIQNGTIEKIDIRAGTPVVLSSLRPQGCGDERDRRLAEGAKKAPFPQPVERHGRGNTFSMSLIL